MFWITNSLLYITSFILFLIIGQFIRTETKKFIKWPVLLLILLTYIFAFDYQSNSWILLAGVIGMGVGIISGKLYYKKLCILILSSFVICTFLWAIAFIPAKFENWESSSVVKHFRRMVFIVDTEHILKQRLLNPITQALIAVIGFWVFFFLIRIVNLILRRVTIATSMAIAAIGVTLAIFQFSSVIWFSLITMIIIGYRIVRLDTNVQIPRIGVSKFALLATSVVFISTWLGKAFLWKFIATFSPATHSIGKVQLGTVGLAFCVCGLAIGAFAGILAHWKKQSKA